MRGPGIDHHVDGPAVDLGLRMVVAVGTGLELDVAPRDAVPGAGAARLSRSPIGNARRRRRRHAEQALRGVP